MDGKGYIYLENQAFSTVNLPHSTITQTSCNFSPLLMFEFRSTLSMFGFPGKIHW